VETPNQRLRALAMALARSYRKKGPHKKKKAKARTPKSR
jgi:hypothetical protein